ncbi:MAG: hypothetical protein AAGF33_17760 [Pseudomonadota bacterium]
MKRCASVLLASTAVLILGVGPVLYDPYQKQRCVKLQDSPFSGGRFGFEVIDLGRRIVWGTSNWAPSEFQAFQPPWHKPLVRKNDVRVGYADSGEIRKSPGCEFDGEYNTMRAFGREFRQVVRLISTTQIGSGEKKLRYVSLEKYHTLIYLAGTTVNVLHAPDGKQYIAVSRSAQSVSVSNALPEGWSIGTYKLIEEFELELSGIVTVIRTPNKDSFQGPLWPRDHFPR